MSCAHVLFIALPRTLNELLPPLQRQGRKEHHNSLASAGIAVACTAISTCSAPKTNLLTSGFRYYWTSLNISDWINAAIRCLCCQVPPHWPQEAGFGHAHIPFPLQIYMLHQAAGMMLHLRKDHRIHRTGRSIKNNTMQCMFVYAMYACMLGRVGVCMDVWMYVWVYGCLWLWVYACQSGSMFVP